VIESNDIELLRRQLTKASETIKSQQAVIKKLNFELEMEQGHVNILRHDNQMLRQMTVDMVNHHYALSSCILLPDPFLIFIYAKRLPLLSKRKNISVTSF
jgi:hypothetical protein